MDLKDFTKKLTEKNSILFMEGRTKGDLAEIVDKNVTVNNFAFLKNEEGEYSVFTVKEIPDSFYFGGMVITEHLKELEVYREEIEKEGLPICIKAKKSKNKKNYYVMEFYPEG